MKKPLILFLVLFVLATSLFASLEMEKVETNAAIAKSPGFAVATPDGITKITRKRSVKYQVNYTYQVAGSTYKIDTKSMDEAAAQAELAKPDVQVAYATNTPSLALLKSDYEQRDLKETMTGAILTAAGFALVMAFVATLVLSWKFSWLRSAA
jgi:hypothetical protein